MNRRQHRKFVAGLYLEFRVAKQFSTNNYKSYIETDGRVPGWFRTFELGYSAGETSIEYTIYHLAEINAANLAILAQRDGEDLQPKQRNKRLKKALQRALQ